MSLLYFGIQNFNRTAAPERAAALSAAPPEALLGLSEPELSSIANWQLATLDNFLIEADANAVLTISTTTPGDEVGEFNNGLDPIVELYYADGAAPEVLIASDDNSASDGRNALLTYTVPSDAAGIYRSAVVPGFWLRVAWLWEQPLPRVLEVLRELGTVDGGR